jgi:AcrR family transcriptional regulator
MSPRTAVANEQIKEARREAILAAARRVFARSGLAATRTGDIAAEAGVSQGLLYHYFQTKDALFTEVVEAALRGTSELTGAARQASGSAWERLCNLCQQMVAGVLEYPEFPLVVVQAFTSASVPEAARVAIEQYGRQSLADITALIQEGQVEGTVAAGDPVELAIAFSACIQGLAMSRLQSGSSDALLPGSSNRMEGSIGRPLRSDGLALCRVQLFHHIYNPILAPMDITVRVFKFPELQVRLLL